MDAAGACRTVLVVEQAASDRNRTKAVAICLMRIPVSGNSRQHTDARVAANAAHRVDRPLRPLRHHAAQADDRRWTWSRIGRAPRHARALDRSAAPLLSTPPCPGGAGVVEQDPVAR